MADLKRKKTIGREGGAGLRDEAAIDIETVGACEEGGRGFVVAHLGMESRAVGVGDVGRVGDEYFVPFSTRFARECGFLCMPFFAQTAEEV